MREWKKKAAVVHAQACLTNSWLRTLRWKKPERRRERAKERGSASTALQQQQYAVHLPTHLVRKVRQCRYRERPLRAADNLLPHLPAVQLTRRDSRPKRGQIGRSDIYRYSGSYDDGQEEERRERAEQRRAGGGRRRSSTRDGCW